MPEFRLHEMGWHAFQQLCHTVLRETLGQTVESYLDNNDGGRDGAFAGQWVQQDGEDLTGAFVVQCKHTARPGYKLSLSDLNDELPKAKRLVDAGRCDTYVLMTNAGMTGDSAKAITEALEDAGVQHAGIFESTWLNQTLAESSRLRRLVPRLYGLGDLTQILDERAYDQARAVLDAMRADLEKLVLTGTYQKAAEALGEHGFVILTGSPATGKTTIAAQLCLGAADEFDTAVVKLDTISDLADRWNPNESQLVWLDDAFGATQFQRDLARAWTLALPKIKGALSAGSRFILTSRDYIYTAARPSLKPDAFPLLNESEVAVDVTDLLPDEKRQILYNHLRHGEQPDSYLKKLQPHLEFAASHPGFTPELARRLADPLFTRELRWTTENTIDGFLSSPSRFLNDVMIGLDRDAQAALGLIFINHNWLDSPVALSSAADQDLAARMGSDLGGITRALTAMDGSLVHNLIRGGDPGWVFAHPTMVDAYADLLRNPELLHHLVAGFPLDVLMSSITCGDVGLNHAIVVPQNLFAAVQTRLKELPDDGEFEARWRLRSRRSSFLASRCDKAFLQEWCEDEPDLMERLSEPGLMLEGDSDNDLFIQLVAFGLVPDALRAKFAEALIKHCERGDDPAVLWTRSLRDVLSQDEDADLRRRIRAVVVADPAHLVREATAWSRDDDQSPDDFIAPLRELADHLPHEFPDDVEVAAGTETLTGAIDRWVSDQDWEDPDEETHTTGAAPAAPTPPAPIDRSVFDDLVERRSESEDDDQQE